MNIQENTSKIRIPESEFPRIVVIGGGFAGLNFAKGLKNKKVQVVFIDKNNFHQFQPLLYQVATSGIAPDNIAFPLRKEFTSLENVFFRMAEVQKINGDAKVINTNIGSINYDYLVIATGSDTNYFGLKDVQKYSLGMKSIQEALDIRSLVLQCFEKAVVTADDEKRQILTNFVVIGGGPAGVEMAGALAEFKKYILPKDYPDLDASIMTINLVEASDKVLGTMSPQSSSRAIKYLKDLGVNVHLKTAVSSYDGYHIKTSNGVSLKAHSVFWNAGVEGSVPKGMKQISFTKGNRLLVNEYSEVKGGENIYAIGDVAGMITEATPKGHPMVAQVAIQQGQLLAKNMIRQIEGKKKVAFQYKDKGSMATVGKRRAVADIGKFKFGGRIAWLLWSFIHLISIIGFKNKVMVGISWAWSYLTFDKGNRLIVRKYKCKHENVTPEAEDRDVA